MTNYSQKTIIKNTVMLYLRMIVIMLVTLYTSRVVLNTLGVIDYGIYNLVGSVVISLTFAQNALMSSTQRFLSFELGKNDTTGVNKVFNTSLSVLFILAAIVVLLLETFGLWFLNNILTYPGERSSAANVAYQFCIITFVLNFLRIPYNAIIIAYEKMSIFAFFSVLEAFFKLGIIFLLLYLSYDKLVLYSFLFAVITLVINLCYVFYCRLTLKEACLLTFKRDRSLTKEITAFSGWTLLGGITGMAANEGPGFFMNHFIGVHLNAAMGIAKQVGNAVYSFSSSFQTAFNPQIVKLYSGDEKRELYSLVFRTSKLSFALVWLISLPIILCSKTLFALWLIEIPDYSIIFSIMLILVQVVSSLGSPLWMLAHAIGNISRYQIVISVLNISILPISWIVFILRYEPFWILAILVFLHITILVFRIDYLKKRIKFPSIDFYKKVIVKCLAVVIISFIPPIVIKLFVFTIWGDFVVAIIALITVIAVFYYIGLNESERQIMIKWVKNRIN